MLNEIMMLATQCNKIGKLVGRFPISIELSIGDDVVNFYTSSVLVTYLAFLFVTVESFASLTEPVWATIGVLCATYVVGITYISHCNAFFGMSASIRAKSTNSRS